MLSVDIAITVQDLSRPQIYTPNSSRLVEPARRIFQTLYDEHANSLSGSQSQPGHSVATVSS